MPGLTRGLMLDLRSSALKKLERIRQPSAAGSFTCGLRARGRPARLPWAKCAAETFLSRYRPVWGTEPFKKSGVL